MELLTEILRLYALYCVAVLALGSLVGLLLWASHTIAHRRNGRHVKH